MEDPLTETDGSVGDASAMVDGRFGYRSDPAIWDGAEKAPKGHVSRDQDKRISDDLLCIWMCQISRSHGWPGGPSAGACNTQHY